MTRELDTTNERETCVRTFDSEAEPSARTELKHRIKERSLRSRIAVFALLGALVFGLVAPAQAASNELLARQCWTTLVGIKSQATGTTTHKAYYPWGEVDTLGTWNNGAYNSWRSSVTNNTENTDSYGFGGQVRYATRTWTYNYCTNFS